MFKLVYIIYLIYYYYTYYNIMFYNEIGTERTTIYIDVPVL